MSGSSPRSPDPPGVVAPKAVPSFELRFRPSIDLIHVVRCFVADFYSKVVGEDDVAHRLALATHELLENACKYSADGEAALYVECESQGRAVSVRTVNRATAEQVRSLEQTFAEISAAPTAAELYLEAMRRTAVREQGSGGLGLARIWAEGDMRLRLVVDGDRVEIHAVGQIVDG